MKWLRVSMVIFGALIITALGIDAADTLSGSRSTLLGQLIATDVSGCPKGMTALPAGFTFSCVDTYEASPSETCPRQEIALVADATVNINDPNCYPTSQPDVSAWTYIARDEAQMLCLRGGKRLPTNAEWQLIAAGTPEDSCNTNQGSARLTGDQSSCMSAVGVYDAVGNVWEWTSEEVLSGNFNGRNVPPTGHVTSADAAGLAVTTSETPDENYSNDYFWSDQTLPVAAIMRGGFYQSGTDAGVYATHAAVSSNMRGEAIGFRCVL